MMNDMKEKIICAVILAAGIIGLGLCIKSPIDKMANKGRVVTVMGKSEKKVKADIVTWYARFAYNSNDVNGAYNSTAETGESIVKYLVDNGIPKDDIKFGAPDVTDNGEYDYNHNRNENRYCVTGVVRVYTNKVDQIAEIERNRGKLFTDYGFIVDTSADYEYKGFQELKPELMEQAIKNAQQTAEQLAENSNSKLDKIQNADQGYFDINSSEEDPLYKVVSGVTHITYSLKD